MRVVCQQCGTATEYQPDEVIWDYGTGYDVKLVRCPECDAINILKYYEHDIDVNNDERYYIYDR